MSAWDQGVKGFATVGKINAYIGMGVGALVGIGLIVFGVMLLRNKNTVKTTGKVTDVVCPSSANPNTCYYAITYSVNGQAMFGSLSLPRGKYVKDQFIDVYYNPNDVNSIDVDIAGKRNAAIIMIVLGVVIPIGAYVSLYFAKKSESYAAVAGASSLFRL